jgi:penicillin-binding protein 2
MSSAISFAIDTVSENQLFNSRLIIAWILMMIALMTIVVRLLFLQIINHENYTTLSENNRLKIMPMPPTRGLIYDRNGVLLADNRISYSLEVTPEQVTDIDLMLKKLNNIITLDESDIEQFKKQLQQKRRFDAIPLRLRLTEDEVARFSVQSYRFPGVEITSTWTRYYPLGPRASHAIGYVGRINEYEMETIDKSSYSGSNYIGKTGVEKFYEVELHGKVGFQHVETNVQGRVLRVLERTLPVAGKTLYLNLDISLQSFIEDLVADELASVVAIEPDTGGVLALVSMPTYDPNLFVNGIDAKNYQLLRDSPDRPLFNRAIRGQYPPGSTVKPFMGLAGLEYGVRTEHSRTWCRGWYSLKGETHHYRDWKKSGHGTMELLHAIEQSCDVYFYSLANDLGIDRSHAFMSRFSFGIKTGIDISGELTGLMPSREWKAQRRGKPWYGGETLIAGIGQGYTLATPLQLTVATATLSKRGQFKPPRVVFAMEDTSTGEMTTLPLPKQTTLTLKDERYWEIAIAGMEAVVHGGRGTARKIGTRSPYRFAGKTGTAQVVGIKQNERYNARALAKRFHDHAWFIAFAPLKDPRIAVTVMVENGGGGSHTAAPLAKKVMDYFLLPEARSKLIANRK